MERTANTSVFIWLMGIALMVFATIVIGGITRLTDSGLSMVEWRPIIGTLPPLQIMNGCVYSRFISNHPNTRKLMRVWIYQPSNDIFLGISASVIWATYRDHVYLATFVVCFTAANSTWIRTPVYDPAVWVAHRSSDWLVDGKIRISG